MEASPSPPSAASWTSLPYSSSWRLLLHRACWMPWEVRKPIGLGVTRQSPCLFSHGILFIFRKRPVSNVQNMHVPWGQLGRGADWPSYSLSRVQPGWQVMSMSTLDLSGPWVLQMNLSARRKRPWVSAMCPVPPRSFHKCFSLSQSWDDHSLLSSVPPAAVLFSSHLLCHSWTRPPNSKWGPFAHALCW